MTRVAIEGLSYYAFHGVTEVERKVGRCYTVNVRAELDFEQAAIEEDLSKTLDYSRVAQIVTQNMKISTPLLETVVRTIAWQIWNDGIALFKLEVEINKKAPFIGQKALQAQVVYVIEKQNLPNSNKALII